ncbi:MAG: AraC family transcriptional regulator [Ruminiclostridium sp.]|nr:AraC family transcriptional regulator [Ruminiclostridium sp.]
MFSWYDEVQKIKSWIDRNIEENISLSQLSSFSGYSPYYVSKKFHELEGISLREYILILKIQHSAIQLNETDDRIIDIAMSHGYSSQEAFTRAFMKVYRISPWSYRKLQKPSPNAEKSRLLHSVGFTKPIGGMDMKIYVKQMYDWNYYAFFAEDVDEKYWDFFKENLWWQIGNSFTRSYDNVKDFEYCAENFTRYGETAIKQQLKILTTPWEKALDLFIPEIKKLGVDWFVHGSVAMSLWGIDVAPKDVNIIIPNYSDFDKVRNHFYKLAIRPIERCENWLMSGLGEIFMDAVIGISFHNKELESYDMSKHGKIAYKGTEVYVSSLEMLRQDNMNFNRFERVKSIEEKTRQIAAL